MNSSFRKQAFNTVTGRVAMLLVVSVLSLSPLLAQEPVNITDFKGCQAIENNKARLLCYDTVANGGIYNEEKHQEVIVEEFGADKMRKPEEVRQAPPPVEPASAGRTTPPSPVSDSSDRLVVTVTRVKKDANGYHYFQTEDNQVWKQQNAGAWGTQAPFEATLKKGMFSSFFLVNEEGMSTRVKRLR
jgi:hypothetical protein